MKKRINLEMKKKDKPGSSTADYKPDIFVMYDLKSKSTTTMTALITSLVPGSTPVLGLLVEKSYLKKGVLLFITDNPRFDFQKKKCRPPTKAIIVFVGKKPTGILDIDVILSKDPLSENKEELISLQNLINNP